jgi:hypothetical protein
MDAMLRLMSVCGILCAALLGAGFLAGDGTSACTVYFPGRAPDPLAWHAANGDLIVVGRVSEETLVDETSSTRFYDSTVDVHAVLSGSLEASTLLFSRLGVHDGYSCWSKPRRLPEGARVLLISWWRVEGADLADTGAALNLTAYFFDDGAAFLISNSGGEPRPAGPAAALIGAVAAAAQSDEGEVARALLTALGEAGDEGGALPRALDEGGDGGRHRLFWPVTGVGLGVLAISAGGLLMGWRRGARL